jgi:tetratricopeptide (TPR) repeat protein
LTEINWIKGFLKHKEPEINPEYRDMESPIPASVYASLKKSIRNSGQHRKIVLNDAYEIVDGHGRFRACKELGLEPQFDVRKFETKEHEKAFIIAHNHYKYRKPIRIISAEKANASRKLSETSYELTYKDLFDKAIAVAKSALKLNFTNAQAYVSLGRAFYHKTMLDKAIENFELVIYLTPKNSPLKVYALERLGVCHSEKGELKKAFYYYEWALTLDPNDSQVLHNYGIDLFDLRSSSDLDLRGNYDKKAVTMLKKAIELKPQDPFYHESLGSMYLDMGLYNKVGPEYHKAQKLEIKAHNDD